MPVLLRLLSAALALAAALGLAVAGRVASVAYGPVGGPDVVAAQVRHLDRALARGAAADMQQLFPEGSFFTRALTASAATRLPAPDLDTARALGDGLDAPESVAVFGAGMVPEHGIFAAGWTLTVAVDVAEASGAAEDLAAVRRRATEVAAALAGSRSGFLEGYPGQYWPCDTVVAAAALARAAVLLDEPAWLATVRTWRDRTRTALDPRLDLLPHRVDADGRPLEGPRGSSQSIIQTFWPAVATALDGSVDVATWARFREAFVVRRAGLVGVLEHPREVEGVGDVDSGPLVLGVSASASAVTLAAARAVGDTRLAADLEREAELLGLPLGWDGRRSYGLGVLPVGEAFLAWARSTPPGPALPPLATESVVGRPLWPLLLGLTLAPPFGLLALAAVLWWVALNRPGAPLPPGRGPGRPPPATPGWRGTRSPPSPPGRAP